MDSRFWDVIGTFDLSSRSRTTPSTSFTHPSARLRSTSSCFDAKRVTSFCRASTTSR